MSRKQDQPNQEKEEYVTAVDSRENYKHFPTLLISTLSYYLKEMKLIPHSPESYLDKILKDDKLKNKLIKLINTETAISPTISEDIKNLKDFLFQFTQKASAETNYIFTERTLAWITRKTDVNSKIYLHHCSPQMFILLSEVESELKNRFGTPNKNRNQITSQIKNTLLSNAPLKIIRADIEDFYLSIPHENIQKNINESGISEISKFVIESYLTHCKEELSIDRGILPGISLSNYLADLYLQEFDKKIKQNYSVLYYTRYVDDIFIVCDADAELSLKKINEDFKELSLNISANQDKKFQFSTESSGAFKVDFKFLGYEYTYTNSARHSPRNLKVKIPEEKIKSLEKKIEISIKKWINEFRSIQMNTTDITDIERKINYQNDLLLDRLRFIIFNNYVRSKPPKTFGLILNYPEINDYDFLKSLSKKARKEVRGVDKFPHSQSHRRKIYRGIDEIFIPQNLIAGKTSAFKISRINEIQKVWK